MTCIETEIVSGDFFIATLFDNCEYSDINHEISKECFWIEAHLGFMKSKGVRS